MALTTAALARDALGLASETALNTLLGTYVTRAGNAIATHCGYPPVTPGATASMESVAYTRYSGDGPVRVDSSRELVLRIWPVLSVASIYEDPDEEYAAGSLVAAADYVLRGDCGEVVRLTPGSTHGSWSRTPRHLKVTWSAGYSTVPPKLEQAATELVAHWYLLRNRRGLQSEGAPDLQTSYRGDTIPPHVAELLTDFWLPGRVA